MSSTHQAPARLFVLLAAGLLGLSTPALSAQESAALSGTVASLVSGGDPDLVPGVTVRLPSLQEVRVTDDAGRFDFGAVPPGTYEILTEIIGCPVASRTVGLDPGERAVVEFRVDRPAIQLPGFVVMGVRREAGEGEPAYAVGTVAGDGMERRSARSIADLIRGEFPGARVMQGTGLPGEEISIQFRGPGSLSGGSAPLVVVDGVVTGGGMVDLNPRDVQNITVLKGSAAAAQYGSRGQAGVIEITTRDGTVAEPEAAGPMVIVDGEPSSLGLAGVDPDAILHMDLVTGAAAGVLLGPPAVHTGVLRIVTRDGGGAEEGVFSHCLRPGP